MTSHDAISPALRPALRCDQWLEALDELNIGAFTVDVDRKITAINCNAQALIGLRAKDVVNKDCREIFTGVPCMVDCQVGRNGQYHNGGPSIEIHDETDTRHLITRMATPIYDQQQQVVGCLTILQDHSPIAHLIERLHYEERSLKYILDSLDIGIFTVNRGGLLTFFNTAAERISGHDRHQVLGQPCAKLFESDTAKGVCRIMQAIDNGECDRQQNGHIIDSTGVPVPVKASYMALRDEKEHIVGGLATFQDLTVIHQLHQAIEDRYTFHDMIGKSPAMQKIFDMVPVVAESNATVLIEGDTGTGKDLLAKIIHSTSGRADGPMIKINCAAIPENLLESEFFGYAKGAFTGADRDKPGRFQEADTGTIFLDEIGDLPLALQAKLLRVIEDREFYPLGSRHTVQVDVRIISATNRHLEQLAKERTFRQDLFYRLNVVRISLPALCQRRDDLPLLIQHILRKLTAAKGDNRPDISNDAMDLLLNFNYPGNVRELENILEHALILCRGQVVQRHHLPDYVQRQIPAPQPPSRERIQSEVALNKEARRILHLLALHDGHRGKTARALGIDRTTLWRKMKQYGLLD